MVFMYIRRSLAHWVMVEYSSSTSTRSECLKTIVSEVESERTLLLREDCTARSNSNISQKLLVASIEVSWSH